VAAAAVPGVRPGAADLRMADVARIVAVFGDVGAPVRRDLEIWALITALVQLDNSAAQERKP